MDEFSPTTDHWNYDFTFHSPGSPQQPTSTPIAKQLQSATIILYINDNYDVIVHNSNVNSWDTDSNKSFDFLLNPICIVVVL